MFGFPDKLMLLLFGQFQVSLKFSERFELVFLGVVLVGAGTKLRFKLCCLSSNLFSWKFKLKFVLEIWTDFRSSNFNLCCLEFNTNSCCWGSNHVFREAWKSDISDSFSCEFKLSTRWRVLSNRRRVEGFVPSRIKQTHFKSSDFYQPGFKIHRRKMSDCFFTAGSVLLKLLLYLKKQNPKISKVHEVSKLRK